MSEDSTHANFRNSEAARTEIAIFLAWVKTQDEMTTEEKRKLSRLADRYQRGRER